MEPPNIAALFSPTVTSMKSSHGGGACPATAGELHPSGGDDIIFYLKQEIQLLYLIMRDGLDLYHSLVDREKMCCSLVCT